MTTSVFVARNLNVPESPTGEYGTIVGGDTCLDEDDGYTGYVEFVKAGDSTPVYPLALDERITFNPALESGSAPITGTIDSLTVDIGFEVEGPDDPPLFVSGFVAPGESVNAPSSAQPATWTRYTLPVFGFYPEDPAHQTALDPDTVWQLSAGIIQANSYQIKRVTYLRIIAEWSGGAKPLRLINRGDALGMGSGRVINPGTRQGSVRLFGPQ